MFDRTTFYLLVNLDLQIRKIKATLKIMQSLIWNPLVYIPIMGGAYIHYVLTY